MNAATAMVVVVFETRMGASSFYAKLIHGGASLLIRTLASRSDSRCRATVHTLRRTGTLE
jgi:hypothetical protein